MLAPLGKSPESAPIRGLVGTEALTEPAHAVCARLNRGTYEREPRLLNAPPC